MLTEDITIEELANVRYKEGHDDGWEGGLEEGKLEIARNLLTEGSTHEFVYKTTGLDIEIIQGLVSPVFD